MKWRKWLQGIGAFVCLGVMFLLVEGMLFTASDGKKGVFNRSSSTTEENQALVVSKNVGTEKTGEEEGAVDTQKVAYLTFDDGPSVLTEEYLKILKEEQVQATFFLIGQQVEGEMVDVVKQAVSEGHEVGLHTYCHRAEEIYASSESYCQDLEKTRLCLEEKLNISPKLFRFPWGSTNAYVRYYKESVVEQMKGMGLDYVDWNVSGEDSVGCPSVDSILANVRRDYKKYNDPVILLHDSATCRATLNSLRAVIGELKQNGYTFATISKRSRPCHFGE